MAQSMGPTTATRDRRFIAIAMDAPMLERSHETALGRRWRDDVDASALHELINSHVRLVVKIASSFRDYGLPLADLIQEGNIGLLQAANRFDPDRNVRFSTYARWWILAGIQEYIVRNASIVRIGTTPSQKSLFFNLRRLRAKGETDMRFYSFLPLQDWAKVKALVDAEGRGDDWLRWGGLKLQYDGSLGSRTAMFYQPYDDAPDTKGIPIHKRADVQQWTDAADAAGLQITIHAIGDKANDEALDIFAAAAAKNGPRDRRFRIEHAQHLAPAAIARFARQQVIASMQPYHAIDDGRWAIQRVGAERLKGTYAFKSLLDAGAKVAFGSDWPVAPLDPLTGVAAAVLRQTIDGTNPGGWLPEQKLTMAQALHAYTATNAYAGFQDDRIGRIAPGMLADFVVMDADLFAIDPAAIGGTKVLRTIVNGTERFHA